MMNINHVHSVAIMLCTIFLFTTTTPKTKGYIIVNGLEKELSHLGFSGHIDRKVFFDILDGNVEGQALGKWVKNERTGQKERDHRPCFDVTFSAPNSVSLSHT